MAIESILPSDSGKVAFEKTGRNFELMDDKINVLSDDRGYATPKIINSGNIDNLPSGKYIVQLDNPGWGYLDVNWLSADEWKQKFTSMDKNNPTVNVRVKQSGVMGDWRQLATTTKTDILVIPRPNRTIIYNNSYKDSMGFVVDVRVKNTDDSDILVGYDAWFDGLPYIGDVYKPISAICLNASGAYVGECGGYRWGGGVYLYPSVVCKSIAVYDYVGGDK